MVIDRSRCPEQQVKRKNGRKYFPPLPFVPADVGPDGKVIVPGKADNGDGDGYGGHAKGNGIVKTESFKETEEERRKREEEEEKEELDRKVCASILYFTVGDFRSLSCPVLS